MLIIIIYSYHFTDIPHFRYDEGNLIDVPYQLAFHGQFGSPTLENGGDQTHYFHCHPPIYYLCLAGVFRLFGYGIEQARLFSMVLALITVLILFQIMREIAVKHAGFFIVSVVSTPLFFVLSKTIRPEMMMALFWTLSFYLLMKWRQQYQMRYVIFGAIVNSLMMMTHMFGIPMILIYFFALIYHKRWTQVGIYLVALIIPTIPYILWIIQSWHAFTLQVIIDREITTKINLLQKVFSTISIIFVSKKIGLLVWTLFIASGLFIIRYKRIKSFYKLYLILSVVLFWIQFAFLPKFNELYAVLMISHLYLLLAMISSTIKKQTLLYGFMAVIIFLNSAGIGFLIKKYHNYSYKDYTKQLQTAVVVNKQTKIIGNFSLIPVFHQANFKAFQTFGFNEKKLIEAINDADYVIVDEFTRQTQPATINHHITNHMKKVKTIIGAYYGSEGQHPNNLIEIYQKH